MTDAIAEFLERGGAIKSCPTAAVVEGSGSVPKGDQQRLAEHRNEREATVTLRWGHQKERLKRRK
jgi:hypothetical protein